jgi:gliding motility-associated-like protein
MKPIFHGIAVSVLSGLLFLLSAAGAYAVLDPPELACASVLPNGDVQLTWVQPPDPNNEFDEYRIFASMSLSGPYAQIASIANYNTTVFTHVGAGANNLVQYYFIHAMSSGPAPNQSVDSDTLATMLITVTQSSPLGSAQLSWNAQHLPPISSSVQEHVVWMEYPIGTWNIIDTVAMSPLSYAHVISICSDSLSFRVSLESTVGCTSFSSVSGDLFEDATPPTAPEIITASVDTATGLSTFKWTASPEDDTQGYILVEIINTGSVIIDTVFGQFTTTYTHAASTPGNGSQTYTVAAFDTCYSGNPPQPNTSATLPGQSTIHLTGAYDECTPAISLQWTPYTGWDSLLTYEVYVETNNAPPVLLASAGPSVQLYVDLDVVPFNDYCYFVKAIGADTCQVSFSNRYCVTTDYPGLPNYNYLRTATVIADDFIRVVDRVDLGAKVSRYILERAENDGPFMQIATQGPGITADIVFNDTDVEADLFSYKYRVLVEDSCGNQALISNSGATMWLRVDAELAGSNNLRWNGYEEWDGQVAGYNIYRSASGEPFTYITTVPPLQWFYDDNVLAGGVDGTGSFCYYVEAVEFGGGTYAPDTVSLSNVACAVQEDQLYIPNAFTPNGDGINDEFNGFGSFIDLSDLKFLIFNRWGQPIWETDDPDESWDGKVNGELVPQGIYGYIYAYSDGGGNRVEKTGTVTLIRGSE